MQNNRKKKQTLVYKPYHTGKIVDRHTIRRALRLFATIMSTALIYLLVAPALNFDNLILRVLLNGMLVIGAMSLIYLSGTRDGFDDVNAGEIVYQHLQNGIEEKQANKDRCFNRFKGLFTGITGCAIPFLIALVYALIAKKTEYSLQALPNWVSTYLNDEGIGDALTYYKNTAAITAGDILRFIVRLLIMPYVNIVGTGDAQGLFTLDRVSPLIMLLPMAAYEIGYLQGPRQRAMVHGNIARNKRRQIKKNKKAVRQRQEPKQLI